MNVCVCLKGGRSPYLYWWCFVFRLPKIKEWIDARDPGAAIIPFSGELESKVSIIRNYSILNCIWEKIPLGKNQWDFLEGYFYRWSISQFVSSVFSKWTMHSTFIGTFQARIITLNIIFKPLMQRSEVIVKCLCLLWGLLLKNLKIVSSAKDEGLFLETFCFQNRSATRLFPRLFTHFHMIHDWRHSLNVFWFVIMVNHSQPQDI